MAATSLKTKIKLGNLSLNNIPPLPGFIISLANSSGGDDYFYDVAVAASGNIYAVGFLTGSGRDVLLAKYNSSGTLQWQRKLVGSSNDTGYDIVLDSSENVYISGVSYVSNDDCFVAKYNSSGVIQWQRKFYYNGNDSTSGIAVDSTGAVYVGATTEPGNAQAGILKWNSSGTLQWQRVAYSASGNGYCGGVVVDSSNNVYSISYPYGSSYFYTALVKYNSSGTLQWQRKLDGYDNRPYGIGIDSSDNIYITGSLYSNASTFIAKYNSSGTIQWKRTLDAGANQSYGNAVRTDSSGNAYLLAYLNDSGSNKALIAKYNSSGTIQWQRKLSGGYNGIYMSGEYMYIAGGASNGTNNDALIVKMPIDGSRTGTYNINSISLTYETSSIAESANTLTDSAGGLTDAANSATEASGTLTESAATLTSTIVNF